MTYLQRINSVISGIISIAVAVLLILYPNYAYAVILTILGFGLMIAGIKTLIYFFTMARYMVGGKVSLYKGVILFDFAAFTLSLTNVPKIYILIYLAGIHAFSGLVEILRANEARNNGAKNFKLKFAHGIIDVFMAICCFVFIKKTNTAVFIYSLGIIYSAILRIITAFRKSTLMYVR
ncbi:DUF308 domain-containing protein [Butyrivibrio sp. YAB3001]|uniref:DUF308 domain-containing protein n=1 Tax=Butyrivibrio sp. YAB3001 TaxID=1520812 RepID=UPI0008F63E0D|nr:DUF308 domain-containing protein [Butyrivibrio sp. YAB3001]SFD09040.1 Short repeat of unknown function [Butyrivibrio sp. YAB3001]